MVSTLRNLFVTLKVQLEEGKCENEKPESELRDAETIRKNSNKVKKKRGCRRHLVIEGGTLNTRRRTVAAAAKTSTETKPQTIFRRSGRERRK